MKQELMIEALQIALAQKTRKANTFKVGSAARAEIEAEAAEIQLGIVNIQRGGTQTDIEDKNKRK